MSPSMFVVKMQGIAEVRDTAVNYSRDILDSSVSKVGSVTVPSHSG